MISNVFYVVKLPYEISMQKNILTKNSVKCVKQLPMKRITVRRKMPPSNTLPDNQNDSHTDATYIFFIIYRS